MPNKNEVPVMRHPRPGKNATILREPRVLRSIRSPRVNYTSSKTKKDLISNAQQQNLLLTASQRENETSRMPCSLAIEPPPAAQIRSIFEKLISGETPWETLTEILHNRVEWQRLVDLSKYPKDEMSMMQLALPCELADMTFKEIVHIHWTQCHPTVTNRAHTPLRKFISNVDDIAVRSAVWDAPTHPSFYSAAAKSRSDVRLGFGRAFLELANFVLLDADPNHPDELDWFQQYLSSHSIPGSPGRNLVRRLTMPSYMRIRRSKREKLVSMCEGLESLTIGISCHEILTHQDRRWQLSPAGEFVQDTFSYLSTCRLKTIILVRGESVRCLYNSAEGATAQQMPAWLDLVATTLRQLLNSWGMRSVRVFADHGSDWTVHNDQSLKEFH